MAKISTILLLMLALAAPALRAGNSDVEIHILPRQVDQSGTQTARSGTVFKSKEHWIYDVTIENRTFKEMAGLELKYLIFFKQEKLASKEAAAAQRKTGTVSVGSLKPHEKKTVSTIPVELNKSNLSGDYYFPSGGKERAQDSLGGLWVRVYQNGQQLAEYANPSTLMREKWE